ncbi:MAG: ATP-binding cassette domain-containing protein [Bryobacterales bacterium]|nr:ATP-binding cassette domain-containing protein [Bryobacterales bacterium]
MELRSPTLMTGRNGVGKTTFAKLLTALIEPENGAIGIVTGGLGGSARLVLQDTVVHLFGHAISGHLGRVFCFDRELWKEARKLYESLLRGCREKINTEVPGVMVADSNTSESMLQCKVAIVVERLLGSPPLLILDEPGWCFSRAVGRAFLESVVEAAHSRGIAVLIISHQAGWWEGLVSDELRLEQEDARIVRLRHSSAGGGRT